MAEVTSNDLALKLRIFGIDPNGTNNPLGQYGMSNLDFAAGSAMGFGEFYGDSASLPMAYDVLANRKLAPGQYLAKSSSLADIVTARNQFDPFNDSRGSAGSITNRDTGLTAAINQMVNGDPGVQGKDRAHYDAIVSGMTGVFGTGENRGIAKGADMFVGKPGTYVNADMLNRMSDNGIVTAPGGLSRFFNRNETLGADELGFGPALGGPYGFPAFGPGTPPTRFETGLDTPSETAGKSLSDVMKAGTDPNDVGGLLPRDVDTTGGVSDPNARTKQIADMLLQRNMPDEYARTHSTQPSWTPEPGAADGWTLDPTSGSYKPDMNFGLPDINPGRTGYPYGKGMDFGLPDIAGNPADLPVQNGAPAFLSYNEQYKQRTGQDYYNPYYEAHKNDGLWVDPTPGGQTHTLDDIVPNGIPTTGPNYVYGTGMDFGLPDINNVGAEGKDSAGNPIWGGYVQDRTSGAWTTPDWSVGSTGFGSAPTADANNPNNVGGNTNTTPPDWQLGDTGFGGGNIGQQPAYTDPTNPTGFSSANVSGGVEPGYFSDMGSSAPINYAAGNTGGSATLDLNGGTSPGFGSFGMGSTGGSVGFDPGDMGDAVTTGGHTDFMNSARALDAYTAQQQAAAVAQRNATDASIANAYAISNSYNPQYNLQNNFNNNVANLNNPLPSYTYSFL